MRVSLVFLLLLLAQPLAAQQVRTAIVPEGITVGDVFQAVIRVSGAGEQGAVFPDTLSLPADVEVAGRRELRRDTVGGALVWTALYPLTAWRPGAYELAAADVRVTEAGRARTASADFPAFRVRSVLPDDTTGIEPKPARDVLGANRVWWPLLLALLVLLLAAAALAYYLRRRRARRPAPIVPVQPATPPRERALAALDAVLSSGALERGDLKLFYTGVSDALRGYLEAVRPQFGMELTTTELGQVLRAAGLDERTVELRRVLQSADLVKFARRRPSAATARDEWSRARQWLEQFEDGAAARAA